MVRREKFQDSNALIAISRQLKAGSRPPTAQAYSVEAAAKPVSLGAPDTRPHQINTQEAEEPTSLKALQSNAASRPATRRRSASVPASDSKPVKKPTKQPQERLTAQVSKVELEKQQLQADTASGYTRLHAPSPPNTPIKPQTTTGQRSLPVVGLQKTEAFASWFASTYTHAFSEELAAMQEGQDMSPAQLKLLLRTLQLGTGTYDADDRHVLSQLQTAGQSASVGNVAAWL